MDDRSRLYGGLFHGSAQQITQLIDDLEAIDELRPKNSDSDDTPIRLVTIEHLGQTWIAYEYDLPLDSNLTAVCMGSDDLQQWTPLTNSPTLHAIQGSLQTWRVMENQPFSTSPKRFVRLDVSP